MLSSIRGQPSHRIQMGLQFVEIYTVGDPRTIHIPNRKTFENGGKLILGHDILQRLLDKNIIEEGKGMHFRIHSPAHKIVIHCGVLDFSGANTLLYAPSWIMEYCNIRPGDSVVIASINLEPGTFMKIQPQSTKFLEIDDPEAVLTNLLPNFSCIMRGQYLRFEHANIKYDIKILDTKPDVAVSLLNTNITVEFAEPVGYTEYLEEQKKKYLERKRLEEAKKADEAMGFIGGRRLDGRGKAIASLTEASQPVNPPEEKSAMRVDLTQKLSDIKPNAIKSVKSNLDMLADIEEEGHFNVKKTLESKKFKGKGRAL